MPRQRLRRVQGEVIVEPLADALEQLLEHPAHREHGRPGVERLPGDLDFTHFPAHAGGLLDHHDLDPARREFERRHQAADTGADHDDLFSAQARSLRASVVDEP